MPIRIIVSDISAGDHANAVKAAISSGYGSDISSQIEIRTGGLSADLAYADSIGAIAVVRSTTGSQSYQALAGTYYPDILVFMPLGSNSFTELSSTLSYIVASGAGDVESRNNTGYGNGLEFWDDDLDVSTTADMSSYSNGVIAGKLLKIKDTLNCTWWEARYRARETAERNEDNRPALTEWHNYNGYGKINVTNAIAYSETIIDDPFIVNVPLDETPEEQTIINIMINKVLNISLPLVQSQQQEGNLWLFKGDTFRLQINVISDGAVFDLSDYTPILTVMKTDTGTTADIQLTGNDIDKTKANEGELVFTFKPVDTENLVAGTYKYDIQISKDTDIYTLIKGGFEIIQDVTKDTSYFLETERETKLITEDSKYLITENLNLI